MNHAGSAPLGWPTPYQSRKILSGARSSSHGGSGHPTKTTPKESTVSSKLILPLIASFALCVAGSATARAESTSSDEAASQATDSQTTPPKKKKKSAKEKKHPNKTELDKAERGNPHSTIYKSRKKSTPNPTNAQIEAGETGNPHSTDFQNRDVNQHNPTNAEINAAEKGSPDAVQPQK